MRSDDSPVVLTVVMISVLVPAIVGLLALIAAVTVYICRQRRQSDIYIPPGIYESSMTSSRGGTYEQPMMSLKGPSHIVGPMEYELAVITPYATSSAAADTHQYDVVAEPDVGVYEKMQSYVPVSPRAAEQENRQYENIARAPADYLQFTPQKTCST